MRVGNIQRSSLLTVPVIYIDPIIALNEGKVDKDVVDVLQDVWKNYDVNIRYLRVGEILEELEGFPVKFKLEQTTADKVLKHISPDIVAYFFGEVDKIPKNFKVYGREDLVKNYTTILSSLRTRRRESTRYRRRR